MVIKTAYLLFSILCISIIANVESASHPAAPAPGPDCSSLVIDMVDCLSFVSNDSTVKKPEGTCCSGLKTVLKTNAECLCEAFKNSAQLGISVNITKALTLPAACHVSSSAVGNCGVSTGSGTAPAMSPGGAMSPSTTASVPTTAAGVNPVSPAPSPKSSVSGLPTSFGSLFLALAVVSLSFV